MALDLCRGTMAMAGGQQFPIVVQPVVDLAGLGINAAGFKHGVRNVANGVSGSLVFAGSQFSSKYSRK